MNTVDSAKRPAADSITVDPITVEIIRNGLLAVTEEMKTNLMRTAYNLIIYEALDFTVGLFTKEGDTISIGLGLPMFIRGMAETVKAKIKHYGLEGIKPGDILVTNDAYITGSHLNHFTFTQPIFHDGEIIAFACCMAHWLDVGGTLGQVTTDIFSEGIQIPIVKYRREGVVNQLNFLDARNELTRAELNLEITRQRLFTAATEWDRAAALTPLP
jgi:N-methylhydantoinase B